MPVARLSSPTPEKFGVQADTYTWRPFPATPSGWTSAWLEPGTARASTVRSDAAAWVWQNSSAGPAEAEPDWAEPIGPSRIGPGRHPPPASCRPCGPRSRRAAAARPPTRSPR